MTPTARESEREAERERSFTLIGDPVAHSPSPAIYEAAFRALGIGATYTLTRVPASDPEAVEETMRRASETGGGGNVTLPHKRRAAACLDRAAPEAWRTGACNCFWRDERGRLAGDNTDVGGFLGAVRELPALSLAGAGVLLVGTGGAARAILFGAHVAGAKRIDVLGRTVAKAQGIIAETVGTTAARAVMEEEARRHEYDLVVNATSLGMASDDPLPLRLEQHHVRAAFDVVYGRDGTAWTRHAQALGLPAVDGVSMLAHQAALSVLRWYPEVFEASNLVPLFRELARRSLRGRGGGGPG